jgi:hypothetical protein
MRIRFKRPFFIMLILLFISAALLTGCGANAPDSHNQGLNMAPLSAMPHEVREAPAAVQDSYRFAAANPEILTELPCYCGCGPIGHTSNYDCYISSTKANGEMVFDNHALGCSICVEITLDAMRLLREDKPLAEIRQYVDDTYSQYGPTNMP